LQTNLFQLGKRYQPRELVTRITGSEMSAGAWLGYATEKYRALYGL